MNGLDLFSGIGGISLALDEWVETVAYCEIEPYCQSVLLSRMQEGYLPKAPIWDDVRTLPFGELPRVDIITGGFPCQDISVAGLGKGLEGERSGLFYEIARLAGKLRPHFVFLENVPAITIRGGLEVVGAFTKMGYDCRWCTISAASVGAMHRRERWFLLAHTKGEGLEGLGRESLRQKEALSKPALCCEDNSHTNSQSSVEAYSQAMSQLGGRNSWRDDSTEHWPFESRTHWQETVSEMDKCSDGLPCQVDRLKALGNSVVPQQVKKAFKVLMGIEN